MDFVVPADLRVKMKITTKTLLEKTKKLYNMKVIDVIATVTKGLA